MAEESIEDRAYASLGFEDAPESEPEAPEAPSLEETDEGKGEVAGQEDEPENTPETPSESELFEYQVGENVYQLPKDIRDELEKAKDYTQKTQNLSAERKQFEIVRSQVEQSHKQYEFANSIQKEAADLQTLDWQLQQGNEYLRNNLQTLSDKEVLQLRMQLDDLKTQKEGIEKSLQSKFSEFQQAQEQAQRELLDKSTEVLRSRISNWDKVKDEVVAFVKGQGFTDRDVSIALSDPRQIQLAHDAMRYRQLKSNTTAAVKKVESATIKPSSRNPMPEDVKRKLNFNKKIKSAGDAKQKARLIEEEMGSRFA